VGLDVAGDDPDPRDALSTVDVATHLPAMRAARLAARHLRARGTPRGQRHRDVVAHGVTGVVPVDAGHQQRVVFAFAAACPRVGILEASPFRFLGRRFVDQHASALVAFADPDEAHDEGGQAAGLPRPARERGVAGRQEDEVVEIGAGQAQRARLRSDSLGATQWVR
jgi:hypothetical protein